MSSPDLQPVNRTPAGPRPAEPYGSSGIWARWVNAILGVWLFISAFVWPHTGPAQTNTWICGVLAFVFALGAMAAPGIRWLNTLLAIWLFFATWAIYHLTAGTLWNNMIVAVVIFCLSFVPSERAGTPSRPQRYAHV